MHAAPPGIPTVIVPHFSTAPNLRRQQVLLQVLYIVCSFLHRTGIVQCSVNDNKQESAAVSCWKAAE